MGIAKKSVSMIGTFLGLAMSMEDSVDRMTNSSSSGTTTTRDVQLHRQHIESKKQASLEKRKLAQGLTKFKYQLPQGDVFIWSLNRKTADKKARKIGYNG